MENTTAITPRGLCIHERTVCNVCEPWGWFPELTEEENKTIVEARRQNFALFFPAYPNAGTQATRTLEAAKDYLARNAPEAGSGDNNVTGQ